MPYQKTKEGRLVNEVTLGDGYPLSNDKQPLKVGGEASIINVSSPTPDGSVDGEVEVKGKLRAKDTFIQGDLKVFSDSDAAPQYRFQSKGGQNCSFMIESAANTLTQFSVKNNQGSWHLKRKSSTTSLEFNDGTNTPLTLDGANVGIGTTSPDVALEINGGSGTDLDPLLRINKDVDGDGSATGILIGAVNAGQSKSGIFFENKGLGSGRGNLYFCNNNTGDSSDATIADARMTITNTGNVGIGTTSPTTTLDVEGTVSYKTLNLSSSTDALDVSGATIVTANSASGNIILGGFANGVEGQIIYVIHRSPTNTLRFEHNEATATQPIFTSTSADKDLSGYGGMTLFCDGNNWFEVGN